ncbi:MAG: phenylalanine--tRNA ligase subunit alpha [Holosporales bacterium]|nr:phenylalanine--tRNA ligase subunit alpha [Holosporales bacterium]
MIDNDKLKEWLNIINSCQTLHELDEYQISLLGKNGIITAEMKKLGEYPLNKKKEIGAMLNNLRNDIEQAIKSKKQSLEHAVLIQKITEEKIDITLPIRPEDGKYCGKLHLLTQISNELLDYFKSRGFKIMDGPELDTDFNCFEALNIPKHHPARQEQDTFYISGMADYLLRTHTSTIQIRTLSNNEVPIRAVSTGAVFRNDAIDATHSPLFHQMEVFAVEPGITIANLKYCLFDLLGFLFNVNLLAMDESGEAMPVRLRPSFFPFTEPSLEVDVCCIKKDGELKLDINGNWLEILGCGMIHKNVFKNCGLSTFKNGSPLQGFAIGFGIERIAMLKYGITDIRNFYDGNIRWLNYYGQSALL